MAIPGERGHAPSISRSTSIRVPTTQPIKYDTINRLVAHRVDPLLAHNDDDDDDDDDGDYAEVLSPDFYIERKQIQMIESLGNGQFGEVYQGILKVSRGR